MCDCYTRWRSLYGQMSAAVLHYAPPPPAYIPPCVNHKCHCHCVQAMPACCCTNGALPDDLSYDVSCLSIQSSKNKQPLSEKGKVKVMKKKNKGGNDYSSDEDSCLAIQSSSKCKQPLSEKRKVKVTKKKNKGGNDYSSDDDACFVMQPRSEKRMLKAMKKNKGGRDYSVDNNSCNRRQSLSKYDEAYIKKKAKKMIKVSNYEDVSSDNSGIAPASVYGRILVEIRAILQEEEEKKEKQGIPFKISEPYDVEGFNASAVPVIKFDDDDDSTENTEYSLTTESEAEDCADPPSVHKDLQNDSYSL